MNPKKIDSTIAGKVGISFYVTGFQDYIGARVLLNNGLLLQGATLACTAVEKYIKTLLATRNLKAFGHLNDWSVKKLREITNDLGLNTDFLKLLRLVYRLRYLDALTDVISFSIERLKFIAELDKTIYILNKAFEFKRGSETINPYESAKLESRPELLLDNHVLQEINIAQFLSTPDIAEAFYFDKSLEVISCRLENWVAIELRRFTAPGIVRKGKTYKCSLVAEA